MRTPTPFDAQFAWWRGATGGFGRIVARALEPQAGFYKRRLVPGGPWVPARIYLHQEIDDFGELTADEVLKCEVNGVEKNPLHEWPWLWNNCIPQGEYEYMEATRVWAERYSPNEPAARPYERLDPLTTPVTI